MIRIKILPLLAVFLFVLAVSCNSSQQKEQKVSKGYDLVRLNRIADVQKELIAKGQVGSNQVVIFKDGEVIYDSIVNSGLKGDENITDDTLFPIWSMTKPITTVAAMILFEEGKFLLDDPIEKYLPEMANLQCLDEQGKVYPCKKSVTIFDVLAHQTGWGYYPRNIDGQHVLLSDLWYQDLEDFSKSMASIPLQFEPGTRYLYGINTSILGRLIEVISKKSLYDFMKERILIPLEMNHTKFHLTDEELKRLHPLLWTEGEVTGFYKHKYNELTYSKEPKLHFGGAGLVSTTKDYGNFCEMLLNKGTFKGHQILSPSSIDLMNTPINPELDKGTFIGASTGFSLYNLTDPVRDGGLSPKGIFGWGGYHATLFWIDHKNNLYGLIMDRSSYSAREMFIKVRIATYQALR
ncbi:serine hydrolase domain-containing protein [Flagellimonas iocasae]|uniref:Serine hydrolase domain-containing protein n=1 Tax=Flagellimonas iocasae TaxID=2055905 RepID=A0ABW4Y499_9FLAO